MTYFKALTFVFSFFLLFETVTLNAQDKPKWDPAWD